MGKACKHTVSVLSDWLSLYGFLNFFYKDLVSVQHLPCLTALLQERAAPRGEHRWSAHPEAEAAGP